jgi:hypothetical protein
MKLLAGLAVIITLVCGLTVVSLARSYKDSGTPTEQKAPGTQAGIEDTTPQSPTSKTTTGVTISNTTVESQVEIAE